MEQPQIRFTRTSDVASIAYYAIGHGPAIVQMPTLPASHVELDWRVEGLRLVRERLAATATLVRYDGRGFGNSDRSATDFSVEAMVRDLEAVTDALSLEPFVLTAATHMAIPALAYAARHPERVTALVLWLGMARGVHLGSGRGASWQELARTDWDLFKETLGHWIGLEGPSVQAFTRVIDESATQEQAIAFFDAVRDWDVTKLLPEVAVPTLVLGRREIRYPSPEIVRELAAGLPSAQLVTLDGSSLSLDDPGVTRAVVQFLLKTAPHRIPQAAQPVSTPVPGGTRTVLFTDIVGHTEMMQRLGDAKGRVVLREHERITRDTLKAHGGAEVKTMGDGFMASFGSVTSALECAIALQRAFATHTESMPEPLRVRVGLNAGEPIEEDGDLFGATVILASRIAAKAGPGEILVPDTVRGLLSGKNFLFSDRGEFVPKGFDDAVRLYEVRWQE
jgi:class 3 adenylate cyclase